MWESFLTVVTFFLMFLLIYAIGYFIIFNKWSPNNRPEASSCLISLFHGTPAAILAVVAILADPNGDFVTPNTSFQNLVLDYSTSYFIADLLHCFAFFNGHALFIGHHLASLFVIVTCRHVASRGAFVVLLLLALAEATSTCQNVWTLADARRREVEFAANVFDILSLPFYVLYTALRCVVGPCVVCKMVAFYLKGGADGVISKWVWVSWVIFVVIGSAASIMWISNLWIEFYRDRTRNAKQKIR